MKKLMIGLLFSSGLLFAVTPAMQPMQQRHVGYFQKIALRTQAPPVHLHHVKEGEKNANYKVLQNKRVIVALIPYGK